MICVLFRPLLCIQRTWALAPIVLHFLLSQNTNAWRTPNIKNQYSFTCCSSSEFTFYWLILLCTPWLLSPQHLVHTWGILTIASYSLFASNAISVRWPSGLRRWPHAQMFCPKSLFCSWLLGCMDHFRRATLYCSTLNGPHIVLYRRPTQLAKNSWHKTGSL